MNILVIGSGGREHAVCRAFKQSSRLEKLYCADGNAGIAEIAEIVEIKPHEIEKLAAFAVQNQIDLTFVGGETALALGIVDRFERENLKIIGASRKAARLEASKSFAKDFMQRHNIPTAAYAVANSIEEAKDLLNDTRFSDENTPVVVKADGLAAGKGVIVAQNKAEAHQAIDDLANIVGKEAAATIVIEEFLDGEEVSLLMFADGQNFALMPPVRDHKRIGEGDSGANTGGMGTITGANLLSAAQIETVIETIIKPTLKGCRTEDFVFRGILFLGLMLTADGIKVLEYNVRFGDPETQVILIRLQTDLIEICEAMLAQTLDEINIEWKNGSSACIVLAAENYPLKPKIGDVIHGLNKIEQPDDVIIFHAGTSKNTAGEFITAGGRVLGATATGGDLDATLAKVYRAVARISWDGMQFRRDIGGKI